MVEKMSIKLTDQIINYKLISETMRDLYVYAFLKIFETSISLITMIFIGMMFKRLIPMVLFWIFLDLLKRRSGGFHCEKYWQCYIATTTVFIGVVMIEPFLSSHPLVLCVLLSVSAIEVMIIGSINHPNMDYDSMELEKSKVLSRRILAIEVCIIASFFMIGVKEMYLTYMSMGVILCAILMSLAKIFKQEVRINEGTE